MAASASAPSKLSFLAKDGDLRSSSALPLTLTTIDHVPDAYDVSPYLVSYQDALEVCVI